MFVSRQERREPPKESEEPFSRQREEQERLLVLVERHQAWEGHPLVLEVPGQQVWVRRPRLHRAANAA